jgi:TonB family protein
MEIFVYLLKVNVSIILLYGFYSLFLRNDTLFLWKRLLFLFVLCLSLLYPLWDIPKQLIENGMFAQGLANITAFPIYMLNEVVVTTQAGQAETGFSWNRHVPELLLGIYFLGVLILTSRMLIQLVGLAFLLQKTERTEINGRKILVKKGLKAPFSFFDHIVMDPEQHTDNEQMEVLRHEETHVRQWHSVDMILSECICIFCWFNPFIWLLKKEILMNLEYLADRSVINSGYNTEHYQFHLLRLSYHKAAAKITNNFNFSPLKKRILMMNKKQTSRMGAIKYAFFLPVVALLLLFNSFNAISGKNVPGTTVAEQQQVTKAQAPTKAPQTVKSEIVDTTTVPKKKAAKAVSDTPPPPPLMKETIKYVEVPPKPIAPKEVEIITEDGNGNVKKTTVSGYVDEMPSFPGGEIAMMKFIQENLRPPMSIIEKGISGTVNLRFIITSKGKVSGVTVIKSLDPACDEEAIRVIKAMPDWIPGKKNGKAVSVYFQLPIKFQIISK